MAAAPQKAFFTTESAPGRLLEGQIAPYVPPGSFPEGGIAPYVALEDAQLALKHPYVPPKHPYVPLKGPHTPREDSP